MIAFGILDALYDEKYKVPGDISVMGCDNTLFAKMHKVYLTTIEHFVIYKGMDACDIIMKKMNTKMCIRDRFANIVISTMGVSTFTQGFKKESAGIVTAVSYTHLYLPKNLICIFVNKFIEYRAYSIYNPFNCIISYYSSRLDSGIVHIPYFF